MVDGAEKDRIGASTTAAAPLSPGKSIQVWGQDDDYCNRTYPDTYPSGSPDKKGACQIIQATGDFGTYNNADAITAGREGKGGYVWFAPYAITDKIFRCKVGYAETEWDKVGYKGAEFILFDGKFTISSSPYNSCIGYGENDNRMMVHDFNNHKIYLCKYSNGKVTQAYAFYDGVTGVNNARFGYGVPTVFCLQGHYFLVTADEPYGTYGYNNATATDAGSGAMRIYEILEDDATGVISLNQVYAQNPMLTSNGNPYKRANSVIHGPAFSTLRHSGFQIMILGMVFRTGYYTYAVIADALPTTACTYIGTYKQNGTSTPTLRRIITCNPQPGGDAIQYNVYDPSNNVLNSGLTNVDARTYIDDNSGRCTSSSTYSYHTKGQYECDARARTTSTNWSPYGPEAAAPAIAAPRTNSTPVVSTMNYYDVSRNAKGYLSYTKTNSGSAGTYQYDQLTPNSGSAETLNAPSTGSKTYDFHLSSMQITPVYHINGHNDSAVAIDWDYYGTQYSSNSISGVDSDCPKPSNQALANSLQTTATAVTQMNMPFSWASYSGTPKGTFLNYEYTIKDSNGTVVASGNTTNNSVTIPDVVVGSNYTAEVRTNYNYNGSTTGGYYSNVVSTTFTPDYAVQDPQIDVNIYKNNAGTVAVWDSEQGWINTTTPVYRIEVDLDEPAGNHLPVSYYRLKVNKNDGNGFVYLSNEELRYFPAGSGNITPAQITSKTTVDATGESHTLYFYWDAYNRSHFPDDKGANTLSTKAYGPRTIYPTPDTNTPENWVFSLEAVYGADNANVTKSAAVDDFQENPTVTSVEDIFGNGIAVKSVVYYNMQGIRLNRAPETGAYIKVSLLNDGTLRTEKLVAR